MITSLFSRQRNTSAEAADAQTGSPADQIQRAELLVAAGITFLVAALHVLLLWNRGPLWRDEISSLALATQPSWAAFWNALTLDPCPVSFFVLLRGWSAIAGDSDFALRTLGCLIGLACLGAFWVSARLLRRKTPILSLILIGASPTLLIWGDSLRAYGLGVFWAVLCFAFFWRVIAQPSRLSVACATAASIMSVHALYVDALVVFACGVAAAAVAARRRLWARAALVLGIGAVAALSLLPYLPVLRSASEWAALLRINPPFTDSFWMLNFALLGPWHVPFWVWVVLAAVAVIIPFRRREGNSPSDSLPIWSDLPQYALLAALVAFASTIVFFRLVGWGTNVWYFLPLLAIVAVAIDTVVDARPGSKALPAARIVVALIGFGFSAPLLLKATEIRASNLDQVAAIVGKHATADDLIIVWPMTDGITFKRYLDRPLSWVTIPQTSNLPAQPGDDILKPFREANSLQPTLDRVEATLRNGGRVWVASSWPLGLREGGLPAVLPLDPQQPRTMGYFLRGWGFHLAAKLHAHASEGRRIAVPEEQPVSIYERCRLSVFSGWKETSPN